MWVQYKAPTHQSPPQIGFVFDLREAAWGQWFEELQPSDC